MRRRQVPLEFGSVSSCSTSSRLFDGNTESLWPHLCHQMQKTVISRVISGTALEATQQGCNQAAAHLTVRKANNETRNPRSPARVQLQATLTDTSIEGGRDGSDHTSTILPGRSSAVRIIASSRPSHRHAQHACICSSS